MFQEIKVCEGVVRLFEWSRMVFFLNNFNHEKLAEKQYFSGNFVQECQIHVGKFQLGGPDSLFFLKTDTHPLQTF